MIRGAIFDLGSTLIRFEGNWSEVVEASFEALAESVAQSGVPIEVEDLILAFRDDLQAAHRARDQDHIERPTWEVLRETLAGLGFPETSMGVLGSAVEAMYRVSERKWALMPGVHEVLKPLSKAGCRLGMISNAGDEANVHRLIDQSQLGPYFEPVLISAAEGIRKPDPRLFETVLRAWELPPQQVCMVGDNLGADILGAQKCGLYTIWLTSKAEAPENEALQGSVIPDAVAETLTEAGKIIFQRLAPKESDQA
ncbi:MAG: HAD family hydrolase [Anaerolineales bacterium]|jgi:HAD superfamily hydrolase (TIGR01662 family)